MADKKMKSGDGSKPKRRRGKAIAVVLLLLVLAAAIVAALFVFGILPPKGSGSSSSDSTGDADQSAAVASTTEASGGWQELDLSGLGLSVSDEDEALEALDLVAPALGLSDVYKELDDPVVTEVDNTDFYRYEQEYKGIPVMDRSVTFAAASDGSVDSMTANTVSLDDVATKPGVSADDAIANVESYLKDTYSATEAEVQSELNDDALVIYTFDVDAPVLAWKVSAAASSDDSANAYAVVVSAEDGSVLACSSAIDEVELSGVKGKEDIDVDNCSSEDEAATTPLVSTILGSGEDGVQVNVYEPGESSDEKMDSADDWYESSDGSYPNAKRVMAGANSIASQQGVSAINAFEPVVNYYNDVLSRYSYDGDGADIDLFTNVHYIGGEEKGANAFWSSAYSLFGITRLGAGDNGENNYATESVVLGHEFTHAVATYTCGMVGNEANSLNEGVADILGICIRAKNDREDKSEVPDWNLSIDKVQRNAANPNPDGDNYQMVTYEDFKNAPDEAYDEDGQGFLGLERWVEEHYGATVISHTAYLIWQDWTQGGDPTDQKYMDNIAKLFYQALLVSSSNPTFSQFGSALLKSGKLMLQGGAISRANYDAIQNALDEQGILDKVPTTYILSGDSDLTVFDVNFHVYGNYNVIFAPGNPKAKTPESVDVVVAEKGVDGLIPLTLKANDFTRYVRYTLRMKDLGESGLTDSSTCIMFVGPTGDMDPSSSEALSRKHLSVYTSFGSSDVRPTDVPTANVNSDIVLVLDLSGSMEGDPYASLVAAVDKFANIAETSELSVGMVTFSSDAETAHKLEAGDYDGLRSALSEQSPGGSTNIEAGLKKAHKMLKKGDNAAKTIILMTDGMPNQGKTGDDLISYAADLKSGGINLYTLGFFNGMDGNDLTTVQNLLESMCTQGNHLETVSENIEGVFTDIAHQLSGERYTFIRVACPVDVTVVSEGQVLSSACEDALVSDFGTISLMNEDGEAAASDGDKVADSQVKLVRLVQGRDYQVSLSGTGTGTMDYSISYMDENGDYVDARSFEDVPISDGTLIQTTSAQGSDTSLSIDEDGDGETDERWRSSGEEVSKTDRKDVAQNRLVACGVGVALVFVAVAVLEFRARKRRLNRTA